MEQTDNRIQLTADGLRSVVRDERTGGRVQAIAGQGVESSYIFAPWAERLFALIWLVFFFLYPAQQLLNVGRAAGMLPVAMVAILVLITFYCVLVLPDPFGGPARSRSRFRLHVASITGLTIMVLFFSFNYGGAWLRTFIYPSVTAGLRLPRRVAIGVVIALALLTMAVGLLTGRGQNAVSTALLVGALGFAKIGLLRVVEINRELHAARQKIARLAVSEERLRMARDLHDSVKQHLFASGMQLAAAHTLMENDPDRAKERLDQAQELVRQAQEELGSIIHRMSPAILERYGLPTALRAYARDWSQRNDIPVDVRVSGEHHTPLELQRAFYRIAQEALANVAKHSRATRVSIELESQNDCLRLQIADDGCGFALAEGRARGYGLSSMRERAETLGGKLRVESDKGKGTRITSICPLITGAVEG